MYFGNQPRNTNSTRENYSQALVAPLATRDSSQNGVSRPLQQTYARYIDQENFNHANHPNKIQSNRVRFDAQQSNTTSVRGHIVSRNPASKSQNVSVQHTRTHTDLHKEYSQEKAPKMGKASKQDQNPRLGRDPFCKATDSPPSLSPTASPEKTTEKKLINLKQTQVQPENKRKRASIPFRCLDCKNREADFLKYDYNQDLGNCSACGAFQDQTAIQQAARKGYTETQDFVQYIVEGIRTPDQKFKAEVPMDRILDRLSEGQTLGKRFNPRAFYVRTREFYIDWMGNLCGELQHHQETFHHSVSTYDAYLQMSNIRQHILGISHFRGKSENQIMTLIAATCIFISAKYHEMTYPGIQQLLEYIGVPFTYEQFVAQEADILNTLDWRVQFISAYDILGHFFCQGILFSTDQIKNMNTATVVPLDRERQPNIIRHNADVLLERCLKKHEFLEYDRLTLACGIIMASRKVSNLVDLWPEQLVAMTGNRFRYPQVKHCMRHILSYFDEISCSISNSVCSSPSRGSPCTVQKTVKRQTQIAMISNHKRCRKTEDNKSQEQTTSKKTASSSIVAMQRAAMNGRDNSQNRVTTPAKGGSSVPKNALASILKRSQEKTAQLAQQQAQTSQQKRGSNPNLNQTQNRIQKSITKKDLSSSKKAQEVLQAANRQVEARAESQPAKQTHSLQKQDSSKYLRADGHQVTSQENIDKRIANRTNREKTTATSQSKPTQTQNVIYKVRCAVNSISEALFAVRPNFGQAQSPSERLKKTCSFFETSGHQKGTEVAYPLHNSIANCDVQFAQIAKQSAAQRSTSKNQQAVAHHGDASSNRVDTQGSSQKKSLSSYLNVAPSLSHQKQIDSQKKSAYQSVNSTQTGGVNGPQTANKLSGAKSNASESTTLKKVVPAHMVKPVTRHASHEGGSSQPVSQNSTNQKLFQRIRSSKVEKNNTVANLPSNVNSGNKQTNVVQSAAPRSLSQNLGQSTADTVKATDNTMPAFMANIQKRSLQKQFESIEMKAGCENDNKNFVVQSMTTNNQRASSKSSTGSAHSFIQKLTTTQKAGVQIANQSSSALHGSAQAAMSAFNRDNSYMTAKQAELHNMRMRSQENRYPTSTSFSDQHKQQQQMMNPEAIDQRQANKICSDFSLEMKQQQHFQRIKSSEAAHEISQVMQAAAKTQREASANGSSNHSRIQAPKVISGPQIMGKGNSKIDISHVQAYLNNLKLQNAAATASHSNSTGGLQIKQQSTAGSSGSGSSAPLAPMNFPGMVPQQVYSRSTSRGKEHAHYSQASKLSAMLGKPSNFIQPISVRSAVNNTHISAHSLNSSNQGQSVHKAPNFHPRPSLGRMKLGSDPKDLPTATVIQASQRHHQHQGVHMHPRAQI